MNSAGTRKPRIFLALLGAVFLIAYLAVLLNFRAESALELRSTDNVPPDSDHLVVQVDILEIDPVMQKVWLRLTPKPVGGWYKESPPAHEPALTLRLDGARVSLGNAITEGRTEAAYDDAKNMAPVDAVAVLSDDSVGNFPFERYRFNFRLSATIPAPDHPERCRNLPVTVEPSPDAGLAGFAFSGEVSRLAVADGMTQDTVELNVIVRRSSAAFWYTILLMAISGALALGCTAVAVAVAFDSRYIQPAFLAWMSATLFAIVGLRRLLPGNPPFGSLPDFLVFMWAEILVALSLISLVVAYLRRRPQP